MNNLPDISSFIHSRQPTTVPTTANPTTANVSISNFKFYLKTFYWLMSHVIYVLSDLIANNS